MSGVASLFWLKKKQNKNGGGCVVVIPWGYSGMEKFYGWHHFGLYHVVIVTKMVVKLHSICPLYDVISQDGGKPQVLSAYELSSMMKEAYPPLWHDFPWDCHISD